MLNVVWLEDEKKLMDRYESMFRENGIELIKCTTPTQALRRILENNDPNLLLDLEFPNSKREGLMFLEQVAKLLPHQKLNVVVLTGKPLLREAVELVAKKKISYYREKPLPSFADTAGQQLFFYELKEHFKEKPRDEETYDTQRILSEWRKKTWRQLLAVMLISIVIMTAYLWRNEWEFERAIARVEQSKFFVAVISSGWFLVNSFLVKNLYDKYNNHSNITNYLARYLKEASALKGHAK
jgi:response regulator RpfG family c-di-GMP phosphodiesterase